MQRGCATHHTWRVLYLWSLIWSTYHASYSNFYNSLALLKHNSCERPTSVESLAVAILTDDSFQCALWLHSKEPLNRIFKVPLFVVKTSTSLTLATVHHLIAENEIQSVKRNTISWEIISFWWHIQHMYQYWKSIISLPSPLVCLTLLLAMLSTHLIPRGHCHLVYVKSSRGAMMYCRKACAYERSVSPSWHICSNRIAAADVSLCRLLYSTRVAGSMILYANPQWNSYQLCGTV